MLISTFLAFFASDGAAQLRLCAPAEFFPSVGFLPPPLFFAEQTV